MYNLEDVYNVAKILNVKFDKFSANDLLNGINIELEHGRVNPETNVTNDNLILTAKIALAHLNEFSNYYDSQYGIAIFEKFLQSKLNK